ncbi:hypothetical protein HY643_01645, partial [Candidatus Woesearchaeota archaeon]|nr:hypothetical protein [Candidatus Woesearchaeota archaeon]
KRGVQNDSDSLPSKKEKINELESRISVCEEKKKELVAKVKDFAARYEGEKISYAEYEYLLNHYLQGKTLNYWLDYYDSIKQNGLERVSHYKKQKEVASQPFFAYIPKPIKVTILPIIFALLFSIGFFVLDAKITGYATLVTLEVGDSMNISEASIRISLNGYSEEREAEGFFTNNTLQIDLSKFSLQGKEGEALVELVLNNSVVLSKTVSVKPDKEVEEELIQQPAEINQPVKWIKRLKVKEQKEGLVFELPTQAENIVVKDATQNKEIEINEDSVRVLDAITGSVILENKNTENYLISAIAISAIMINIALFVHFKRRKIKKLSAS